MGARRCHGSNPASTAGTRAAARAWRDRAEGGGRRPWPASARGPVVKARTATVLARTARPTTAVDQPGMTRRAEDLPLSPGPLRGPPRLLSEAARWAGARWGGARWGGARWGGDGPLGEPGTGAPWPPRPPPPDVTRQPGRAVKRVANRPGAGPADYKSKGGHLRLGAQVGHGFNVRKRPYGNMNHRRTTAATPCRRSTVRRHGRSLRARPGVICSRWLPSSALHGYGCRDES